MFNSKKEKYNRVFDIFKVLLIKIQKNPMHILESDVVELYKRSTQILETIEYIEYIHKSTGAIDDNIIKGEELYD